jgi:hypothetical protein
MKKHKGTKGQLLLLLAGIRIILLYYNFIEQITILLHQLFPVRRGHLKIKGTEHKNSDGFLTGHLLILLSFMGKTKEKSQYLFDIYTY